LNDYEAKVIQDKIIVEIQLALDSFKTTVVRSSTSILDLLGDLGGFYGSIGIVVFLFGEYFSEKFFL